MKNLTSKDIFIQRQDGTRFVLPAAPVTPSVTVVLGDVIGEINQVPLVTPTCKLVAFDGITLDIADGPFIVDRDVFDALPCNAKDFITPDLGSSAIRNSFNVVHVVTQFFAKSLVDTNPFIDRRHKTTNKQEKEIHHAEQSLPA